MISDPPADRARNALRLLIWIALYSLPLFVALRPIGEPLYDPDVWWHLRVGQWVAEHGTVPRVDPFSYPADKPWVAYSWLYEVVLFGLYQQFGLQGIIAYRVTMAMAVALALHALVARRELHFLVATVLTAAGLFAIAGLLSERPWLFTILFGTITLITMLDLREGRRSFLPWFLPLMFVLWANIHIQFIYGLGLLALACIAPWLDRTWRLGPFGAGAATPRSRGWRRLLLLSVLCGLATLVNPYHLQLYRVVVEYALQPGPYRYVNELKSLGFREPCDWVMLGLGGAAAFSLGRRPRWSSFDLLLLAGAAVLAFRAQRDLWLLVVVSLATLTPVFRDAANVEDQFSPTPLRFSGTIAGLLIVGAGVAWQRDLSNERLDATVARKFPVEAAAFVASQHLAGPLFNDFNWGGFLIWALPDMPVVVDGRTNLHGDELIQRVGNVWAGGPGWQDDPDLARANVVLAPVDSVLAGLLTKQPRFQLVHTDDVACVFVDRRVDTIRLPGKMQEVIEEK